MNNEIFNLINLQDFNKLKKLLLKNKNINLEIKDTNHNFLLNYIVTYNQIEILKILLDRKIRIDILDLDGRTILYIPIKFNYIETLKLLISYNNKLIGISIIDIKDKLGYTALHYAVILNNIDIVKILIESKADPYIKDNEGNNSLHLALKYGNNNILKYFLDEDIDLDFISSTGESFLQSAISYNNLNIIDIILTKKININKQEYEHGLIALHQAINLKNFDLVKKLINLGADINKPDFYGNISLHYAVSSNSDEIINYLITKDIKFNSADFDGNTPLHLLLINNYPLISDKFIIETDLSLQNNEGDSCLHYLFKYENINEEILINKELNIFILNNENINCYQMIKNNQKLMNIVINSYYNYLLNNKNELKILWEKNCANNKLTKDQCIDKIKEIIVKEERSIPKTKDENVLLNDGIATTKTYFYTGNNIDVLFGILFLSDKFNNLNILLSYPLSNNEELEKYYDIIGMPRYVDFNNFEIIWSYQKLFFPTYFDTLIKKKIKNSNYIVIPIGIEISDKAHANILFYDVKKNIIERFEPNGANHPLELNYNSHLLDELLLNKFKEFNPSIKFIKPQEYLPVIGFQILENINNEKFTKIGDPNGFCGVWCTWWIYQKMNNIHIPSKLLVEKLIKEIKLNKINFKNLIRNFGNNIVKLRDNYLNKYKMDINDWIHNDDPDILSKLEKDIITIY